MSIDNPENIKKSRWIYLGYYLVFSFSAVFAGLAIRVLMPELINADPEMGFPLLAEKLLPAFLVGMILAGIFAATISTADSQILSCSAAITQDIYSRWKENLRASHSYHVDCHDSRRAYRDIRHFQCIYIGRTVLILPWVRY